MVKRTYEQMQGYSKNKRLKMAGLAKQIWATKYYGGTYKPYVAPKKRANSRTGGFIGRFQPTGSGTELKFFDTTVSFTADVTGEVPVTGQWSLIPQGTAPNRRIGQKLCVKSIYFKGNAVFEPGTATTATSLLTIYVLLDKQCNGTAATVPEVFNGTDLAVAHMNIGNSNRFTILKKITRVMTAQAGASAAYNPTIKVLNEYIKCNIPIKFTDSNTDGSLSGITDNNIFIMASCFGSDDLVTVQGSVRLRYTDN